MMWELMASKRRRSPKAKHSFDEERGGVQRRDAAPPPAAASRADVAARCRPQLAWSVAVMFLLLPALQAYVGLPDAAWKALLLAGARRAARVPRRARAAQRAVERHAARRGRAPRARSSAALRPRALCQPRGARAAVGVIAYQVVVFPRWGDEAPLMPRFAACFGAMIAELLAENVMVWVVSATDLRKYDDPPGLQDNGEIALHWLAGKSGLLSWVVYGKAFNIMHFLGAVLALAFSVAWDQHPYSGFGVMSRFSLTICCSRLLRTACFMSTVLPSPRPGCYRRRFPPPPDTWWGMLAVGVRQLRGFGGCNDLIFSGHGAFWVLGPLTFQTYYPHRGVVALLWAALAQTCGRDVVDRQHYTVDMLLAVVVTWAVWDWTAWVYPPGAPLPRRPDGAPRVAPSAAVLAVVALGLVVPAVVVFVAKS
ncbi:IPCS1 [Scenedesmus sp. PABB004]|nr:IPCS1 [Scenedesmus sp. PABB004]